MHGGVLGRPQHQKKLQIKITIVDFEAIVKTPQALAHLVKQML
jgi:hypothetical protein